MDCIVHILVVMQPLKEEPSPDFKCKDKFLVQSVALLASESEFETFQDAWSNVEKTRKNDIFEKKLRCVYEISREAKKDIEKSEKEVESTLVQSPSPIETKISSMSKDTGLTLEAVK
ncbi:hypothetical protein ROZALSC1DRAFT_23091 [Rozella allomycis CSF55]|uniref:MSP domain-containing protein n=1 Tax=Rozella allomycis (strain CSF55) TaxID=988480 RepID=A0A4P9YGY4_ROZAC|nr:hypothetical protein ROZALSC1DRAFT_23091 [Rozella allomycis CSF55]